MGYVSRLVRIDENEGQAVISGYYEADYYSDDDGDYAFWQIRYIDNQFVYMLKDSYNYYKVWEGLTIPNLILKNFTRDSIDFYKEQAENSVYFQEFLRQFNLVIK